MSTCRIRKKARFQSQSAEEWSEQRLCAVMYSIPVFGPDATHQRHPEARWQKLGGRLLCHSSESERCIHRRLLVLESSSASPDQGVWATRTTLPSVSMREVVVVKRRAVLLKPIRAEGSPAASLIFCFLLNS